MVAQEPSSGSRSRAGSSPCRFGSGGFCLRLIGEKTIGTTMRVRHRAKYRPGEMPTVRWKAAT